MKEQTHSTVIRRHARSVIWLALWLPLAFASPSRAQAGDATPVTDDNVAQRIAEAKTADDHETLATYARTKAVTMAAQAKLHEGMLKSYGTLGGRSERIMAQHCERLIQSYRQEQKDYQALAQAHEDLAKSLRPGAH